MKRTFSTEAAYFIGLIMLAIGTAFMERADFGMSMVVAPAYLLHLKISEYLGFFSFGMAEYILQAFLIIVLVIIQRKVNLIYLFSFVTAVIYGFILDGAIAAVALIPFGAVGFRVVYYVAGMLICSGGVALLFRTYIAPEAYELFVKEFSARFRVEISRFKTVYDCVSCAIAILLSFAFFGFGHFEGVKWGTIICALLNGWLIGKAASILDKVFDFRDSLPLRKHFEK